MAGTGHIADIPEFRATRSIKLGPNTAVPVTERILRLVDSKAFQRLRKIRQLSLSDRVFPSATHTRFSHALGVYHNVLDYLRRLDSFSTFHERYTSQDYLAILLAGLLHDLGHYPCSHQLDHLEPFPQHETLTVQFITGQLRIDGEDLGSIINDAFKIEPTEVAKLLGPKADLPPKYLLLKQIIDSPLDADKCDYLPRDSYFCGVDYGTGFDRERFIQNLMPAGNGIALGIYEKGLMSAERFQLARYWMYRSVYWGHTVRAIITMLNKACEDLKPIAQGPEWLQMLVSFSDSGFMNWLHQQVEGAGRELVALIHDHRRPYKRLYTISYHREPEIYEQLRDPTFRQNVVGRLVDHLGLKPAQLKPTDLIWDIPPKYKQSRWDDFSILTQTGQERSSHEESPVIGALSQAFLHGVRKIRLFCHPDLVAQLRAQNKTLPPTENLTLQRSFEF